MPKLTELMSKEETERTDDMVGCGSLTILACTVGSILFLTFAIYRIVTGGPW